jgi:hypothetical protein
MIHRGGECRDIAGLIPSKAPSPGAA